MKPINLHKLPIGTLAVVIILLTIAKARADSAAQTVIEQELDPKSYQGPRIIESDSVWVPDILAGYEHKTINLGESFDGPVCCTVVRRLSDKRTHKAVLYVHGFNDYFFQKEMGERFNDSTYNFYAVDLRRYGRSLRLWQYPFDVRKIDEYFQDIDSALNLIKHDGNTDITLSGHSTGGLTVLAYASERGARVPVKRVVTDSPFLEWNFNGFYRKVLLPMVSLWGAISPSTKIDQGHCDAYAESLLKQYHGQWEYNTDWKMVYSPPVKAGWIRAISRAQSRLMKHGKNITVPVLVMHSSQGMDVCAWTPECNYADLVLNPDDIQKRGLKMGKLPVVSTIENGIHDLILSEPEAREAAYYTIFNFISSH